MNICGEKIILRAIEAEDSEMLLKLINDPETEKYLCGSSFPISSITHNNWINSQAANDKILRCTIVKKDDLHNSFGTVILSDINRQSGLGHIHIKLLETARGQGIGFDAINTMLGYAFNEQRLNCVIANVLLYNTASQKLFEKCGFLKEGILRNRAYKNGKYEDVYSYSILKDEYDESKRNRK